MSAEWLEVVATRAGWAVLHSLWQGVIVGLALALVLPFLRSAAARHALGMLAMAVIAALLITNMTRNSSPNAVEFQTPVDQSERAAAAGEAVAHPGGVADRSNATGVAAPLPAKSIATYLRPSIPWIAGFWLIGVVLLSLRQIGGWWDVRQWRTEGTLPASPEIQVSGKRAHSRLKLLCAVPIFVSERVAAPVLVGVLKPAILLPVALVNGLKVSEIEAILAHELAHFRRRDGWANLLQIGIETLLFYHPVVWWLGRLTRRERENAADDLAVRSGTKRDTYLMALAAVAEFQFEGNTSGPAVAASGGPVLSRIRRLLVAQKSEQMSPAMAGLAGLAGGLALIIAIAAIAMGQVTSSLAQEKKSDQQLGVSSDRNPSSREVHLERERVLLEAREAVKPWIDDAFQLDDIAKRDEAIEKVRTALKSSDVKDLRRGLVAFPRLGAIQFDRASFHDLFLPILSSEDASLRLLAAESLVMSGVREGDLDRLIALAYDPDQLVRRDAVGLIFSAAERDLTEPAVGNAILALLSEGDAKFRRSILGPLWGAKMSPAVEARVIELSRQPDDRNNALYYTLSTQSNKSEASVKRLIEFLADEDITNVAGRAAWGLGQGVAPAQYSLIADAALKVVSSRRRDTGLFSRSMGLLSRYAGPDQVEEIKALLAKPGVDGKFQGGLEGILASASSR